MIYFSSKLLKTYNVKTDGTAVAQTAYSAFTEYAFKLWGGKEEKEGGLNVVFEKQDVSADKLTISFDGETLRFGGGKRGIIYGVYEFLERYCGVRFYAITCETYPEGDVNIEPFEYTYEPFAKFRQYLGNSAFNAGFALKRKLNGNLWKTYGDELGFAAGDAYDFAGVPAHSLTGDYLLKPYIESNPEFFALKNGKRWTNWLGQVCPSCEEAKQATIYEVKKLLKENPGKEFVSVSQGDNPNFCECDKCKEVQKTMSMTEHYLRFVNDVAIEIKKEYPEVFVHTFAYANLMDPPKDFELSDNVMIQYCLGNCYSHLPDDPTCPKNRITHEALEKYSKFCKSLMCWDYQNTFRYQLVPNPEFDLLRQKYAYLAGHNVRLFFAEADHRPSDGWAAFPELRCYLTTSLMWNPYMSAEEYDERLNGFLNAFYGKEAAKNIGRIIEIWDTESDYQHSGYGGETHLDPNDTSDAMWGKLRTVADLIHPDRHKECIAEIYACLKAAYEGAETARQKTEIEKLSSCFIWYDLMKIMDDVLENGTEEEKARVFKLNAQLVAQIKKFKLKLTFWGITIDMQLDEMERDKYETLPPSKWNYKW